MSIPFFLQKGFQKLGLTRLTYRHKLRKYFKTFCPDVAIAVLEETGKDALYAAKGLPIKIINTEHNSFERPSDVPLTRKQIKEKFEENRNYDHFTVLTQADKNVLGDSYTNVSVLPNPLAFEPIMSMPTKEKIILASGRLGAWHYKGFDILIDAWAQVAHKHSDWKLQIAGADKNNALQFLRDRAKKHKILEQIDFLGFSSNIIDLYKRSSIFVLSSRYEGFGMVLIEAMSQGCACIACDYKGRQSEIITTPLEGILCQPEDVNALAEAINTLIENETMRLSIQKKAIERSKFYSLDNIIKRWNNIFRCLELDLTK